MQYFNRLCEPLDGRGTRKVTLPYLVKGEENGFEIFRIPRIAWVPGLPGDARERRGALWTLRAIWVLWLFWISWKPEETKIIVPRFNGSVPLLRHAV